MSGKEIELVHGSANVFRDFGEPHADLKRAKAVLAARIIAVLDDRGLPVREAASLTGFAAADFSRIRNADLGHFTLDWLMKMLAALDANARVTVKVEQSDRSATVRRLLARAVHDWKLEHYARQYGERKLTLARAARDAGVSLWEMMDYARSANIPAQYELEDLQRDVRTISTGSARG